MSRVSGAKKCKVFKEFQRKCTPVKLWPPKTKRLPSLAAKPGEYLGNGGLPYTCPLERSVQADCEGSNRCRSLSGPATKNQLMPFVKTVDSGLTDSIEAYMNRISDARTAHTAEIITVATI